MKRRVLSLIVACCLFVSGYFFGVRRDLTGGVEAATATTYNTYTMSDTQLHTLVPSQTVNGKDCYSMQGMNVGTTYIYNVKINTADETVGSADAGAVIMRTTVDTGETVAMDYYASENATEPGDCNTFGHANGITVYTYNSVNYMYVATLKSPLSLTRVKISGTGLYFTGHFKLIDVDNNNTISPAGIKCVKQSGGYFYFIVKSGMQLYYTRISATASGGTASAPTEIKCCKLFALNTRNAVFNINGKNTTIDYLDTWTNQDFSYNSYEDAIYVPLFDSSTRNRNVILVYTDVSKYMDAIDLSTFTGYTNETIYPCNTNFYIEDTSLTLFEIESCGFRTGGSSQTDKYMYFNTNTSDTTRTGIYRVNYERESVTHEPIVDSSSIIYNVKYAANGGSGSMSSTVHIRGIAARLKKNTFTRSGYTFAGWYLTRSSDTMTLYLDKDGTTHWFKPGNQPDGCSIALYEDGRSVSQLTAVHGDTVTCTAQWVPVTTGTTSYYVEYNANGGTGSMSMQKIVYGTSTGMTANAFIKEGYTFSGWTCYRRSDNKWIFKNLSGSDTWQTYNDGIEAGYTLKVYQDGANIAKTSATDCDIVTMYAQWTDSASSDGTPTALVPTESAPISSESVTVGGQSEAVFVFESGAAVSSAKSYFNDSSYVRVLDSEGNIADDTAAVGTGMTVQCVVNGNVVDERVIILKGDTDGDGSVSVADASSVMAHVKGNSSLTSYAYVAADVCIDGTSNLNILNVMAILNLI